MHGSEEGDARKSLLVCYNRIPSELVERVHALHRDGCSTDKGAFRVPSDGLARSRSKWAGADGILYARSLKLGTSSFFSAVDSPLRAISKM